MNNDPTGRPSATRTVVHALLDEVLGTAHSASSDDAALTRRVVTDKLVEMIERDHVGGGMARRDDYARDVAQLWSAHRDREEGVPLPAGLEDALDRLAEVYDARRTVAHRPKDGSYVRSAGGGGGSTPAPSIICPEHGRALQHVVTANPSGWTIQWLCPEGHALDEPPPR